MSHVKDVSQVSAMAKLVQWGNAVRDLSNGKEPQTGDFGTFRLDDTFDEPAGQTKRGSTRPPGRPVTPRISGTGLLARDVGSVVPVSPPSSSSRLSRASITNADTELGDAMIANLLNLSAKENKMMLRVVLGATDELTLPQCGIPLELESSAIYLSTRSPFTMNYPGGYEQYSKECSELDRQRQQKGLSILQSKKADDFHARGLFLLGTYRNICDKYRPYFLARNADSGDAVASGWKHSVQLLECDVVMARLSLCHLNFNEMMDIRYAGPDPIYAYWQDQASKLPESSRGVDLHRGKYPLLDYAVRNWALHVRNAQAAFETDHRLRDCVRGLYTSGRVHVWTTIERLSFASKSFPPSSPTQERHKGLMSHREISNFALACHNGHELVLKHLWKTNSEDHYVDLAQGLQLAIIAGHLSTVRYLIQDWPCVDLMTVEEKPTSPLMTAVQYDRVQIVKLLVEHGANPDLMHPTTGQTPLEVAILHKKTLILHHLLKTPPRTPFAVRERLHWLRYLSKWGHYNLVTTLIQTLNLNRRKPTYAARENPLFDVWSNGTIGLDRVRMMQHLVVECPYLLDAAVIEYAVEEGNVSFLDAVLYVWGKAFGREAEWGRKREVFLLGWQGKKWRLLQGVMRYAGDGERGTGGENCCYVCTGFVEFV